MKIVALVPIKLNSERVKDKNIRRFCDGTPLVQFICKRLIASKKIDDVYVYCSDEKIKKYLPAGVNYLRRPEFLDLNSANCNDIIREFIKVVHADYYVVSHATAPFTRTQSIDKCIDSIVGSSVYDSAFIAKKLQAFLWDNGKPVNFDLKSFPRTQELSPFYLETSGAYVFSETVFKKYDRRVGISPCLVETDGIEGLDIDTEEDMQIAQAIYSYMRTRGNGI